MPEDKIKKSDATITKIFLNQEEMKQLDRMGKAYLDFAVNIRYILLTMQYLEKRLDSFIEMLRNFAGCR